MLGEKLENVRKLNPLVHNITNYVTVNDCANILIACGGAPIMSDEIEDVKEITSICSALNINIGTLNHLTIPSMFEAGKISNKLNHPILLDPVGAGASTYRTNTAKKLIEEIQFSVIRGNISEIKALAGNNSTTKGVDASEDDAITLDNIDQIVSFAKEFAKKTNSIIIITGAKDIIANSEIAYIVSNGHPMMSKISGTGCMLSAMTSAYIAANQDDMIGGCLAAICAMGICGQRAFDKLQKDEGNLTYKNKIFDEIFNLNSDILEKEAQYEIK